VPGRLIVGERRALVFTAPGQVEVLSEPIAPPAPGQVLVATQLSAISAGTERLAFRGQLPAGTAGDETLPALRQSTFTFPFRYGYAQVGEVRTAGDGVDAAWIGRRVFAFHPHASAFLAAPADLLVVPDDLPAERAALFAHMETAVNLILDGGPMLGEKVLVIGQGVIGLLTTALLARFPLALLAACEAMPLRSRAARACGAQAILTTAGALEIDIEVERALGPRRADLVYELSGDPAALDVAIAAAGHEARIVVGSWYGDKRAPIDLGGRFHRRRLRIVSSQVSHIGAALGARWDRARRADTAWKALRDIDTLPLISHRFSLAEAQAAYELIDRRPAETLQVLLTHSEA
jgi:2-desacetyl-2-hydroxyethyl bacteriochlorophyllide A dehydrogenase